MNNVRLCCSRKLFGCKIPSLNYFFVHSCVLFLGLLILNQNFLNFVVLDLQMSVTLLVGYLDSSFCYSERTAESTGEPSREVTRQTESCMWDVMPPSKFHHIRCVSLHVGDRGTKGKHSSRDARSAPDT